MNQGQFDRFVKYTSIPDENGCMNWTGTRHSAGYGTLAITNSNGRTMKYAHRLSYEYFIGPIPEGLHIDHLCRNRLCVNPEHLEPVTCKTNILRGIGPSAKQAKITHCPKGHPYSGDNLKMFKGHRQCKECMRQYNHTERRRKKHNERAATYIVEIRCKLCGNRAVLRKQYRPQEFCNRSCAIRYWRNNEHR